MGGKAACRRRLGRGRLARGCARSAGIGECLRFVWGASGSAAENRRRCPCPACSLSPHLLTQPSWLPISPPQPAASLICPPTRPLVPARPWFLGSSEEEPQRPPALFCPRLAWLRQWEETAGGEWFWGAATRVGGKSAHCHSGRAWGECGRPQVRPGFPQLRGARPQPAPRSRQPLTGGSRGRRAGRGLARRPGRGRGQAGAGQGGGDLGTPVLFHHGGRGGLFHAS